MSEIMRGVLNMPPECWGDSPIEKANRYSVYQEAWREIESLRQQLADIEAKLKDPAVVRANILRGVIVLPRGYGETDVLERQLAAEIERGNRLGRDLYEASNGPTHVGLLEKQLAEARAGQVLDEREAFEKWATEHGVQLTRDINGEQYHYPQAKASWSAWQARSLLAQPQQEVEDNK